MMCDVGAALGMSLGDVGELELEELSIWAAHLKERRELENVKWDLRLLGLCRAMLAARAGQPIEEEIYFRDLLRPAPPITDEKQIERRMAAWARASKRKSTAKEIKRG